MFKWMGKKIFTILITLKKFPYRNLRLQFSTKTYVVGTQKNHLDETVLLSTQNACVNGWARKYLQFYVQKAPLSKPTLAFMKPINTILVIQEYYAPFSDWKCY